MITICLIICLSALLYLYIQYYAFNYWICREVPCIPTKFPFGNLKKVITGKVSFTDQIGEFYEKTKNIKKYLGLFFFHRKVLLAVDIDLVNNILNKDFQYFGSRGIYYDEKNDPLSAHLVSLYGDKWKNLRTKLTPTFTPNKIKKMFDLLLECSNQMSKILDSTNVIEIKDITSRYTTDVIGLVAFGILCNSLKDPDAEFRKIGKTATTVNPSRSAFLKRLLFRNFPAVAKILKLKVIDPSVSSFFMRTVKETIENRNKYDIKRNDFLQLLINLMENGSLSIEQIAAQCFVFFIAGVETSASTLTFAFYELAKNVNIQDRLRSEILTISEKNGQVTYDGILEMSYLNNVILETMRKYPAFTVLMRRCTQNYQLPDSSTILEKGTTIVIPVYAIHHDSNYYENPEEFNPDRFNKEDIKNRTRSCYLPFGNGPRICIGKTLALLQLKLALAVCIRDFEFKLNDKSTDDLQMDKTSFILSPSQNIYLNVSPILKHK